MLDLTPSDFSLLIATATATVLTYVDGGGGKVDTYIEDTLMLLM